MSSNYKWYELKTGLTGTYYGCGYGTPEEAQQLTDLHSLFFNVSASHKEITNPELLKTLNKGGLTQFRINLYIMTHFDLVTPDTIHTYNNLLYNVDAKQHPSDLATDMIKDMTQKYLDDTNRDFLV